MADIIKVIFGWLCILSFDVVCFFVQFLGFRGILDLLGVRQTVGSADILPPTKEHLIRSFLIQNRSVYC